VGASLVILGSTTWTALLCLTAAVTTACYEVKIDTLSKWCEHISGADLTEGYAPTWAILPSVSFHYADVRADFVHALDSLSLAAVQHRAPRMAWQEGTTLHIVSPSDLVVISPDSVLAGWRRGLDSAASGYSDPVTACVFWTAASLFDTVTVHFGVQDTAGRFVGDTVVKIPTARKQVL
jgi:hypothetical protein